MTFLARWTVNLKVRRCNNYFVTAAALSPSRQRAYKLILRPLEAKPHRPRRRSRGCLYRGQLVLAPNEELGRWSTYLFAQTRNDVPLGTPPDVAAERLAGCRSLITSSMAVRPTASSTGTTATWT